MAHGERESNKRNWCGRDYWGRRALNALCSPYRGNRAHHDPQSHKRRTHRYERRIAKLAIANELDFVN